MRVKSFYHAESGSFQYVCTDMRSRKSIIIDPVLDFDRRSACCSSMSADALVEFVRMENLTVEWVIDTHPHADHISAANYLASRLGAPTAIGEHITKVQEIWREKYDMSDLHVDGRQWSRLLCDGETVEFGDSKLSVMYAPGHTAASIVLIGGDVAFVNDTLFMPDIGTARADFPGASARELWQTLRSLLMLPDQTRLFVGHDYPTQGRGPSDQTTIGAQRSNVHLSGRGEEEFIRLREDRDASLPLPDLMLIALQININGGHLPDQDSHGRRFLKIPMTDATTTG